MFRTDARTVLLSIFGVGWLAVVVLTAANNKGTVPEYLWAMLGIGVGSIMGAFRVDDLARNRTGGREPTETEPPPAPARPATGESGATTS